jgi:probable F420-dependent oxidoreductase
MKLDAAVSFFEPNEAGAKSGLLEAAGYDGLTALEGVSDPFIRLALAAPHTQRADLITAIAVAFARNPMTVALTARDLNLLSNGRFILGLGTQVKAHIERRFSMPWSQPAARMREFMLALRHIWNAWETGTKLSFEGKFYRHTLNSPVFAPPPSNLPPVPIYLAAVGPKMTQLAGELADGVLIHPFNTEKSLRELSLPNLQRGAASRLLADRCQISAQIITVTALNPQHMDSAIAAARHQIGFYASTPAYRPVLDLHGWGDLQPRHANLVREGRWQDLAAHISDEMLETFAVVGSVSEAGAKIKSRCGDAIDRISPLLHQPDIALYTALAQAIKAAPAIPGTPRASR